MKIDIHAHTKKCKSGDAETRNIYPKDFCEKIISTEVGIIAITNHNHFDLEQYNAIQDNIDKNIQVWPGIELDIMEGEKRGHLLVIVSPSHAQDFSSSVEALIKKTTPDAFRTSIDDVLKIFDSLNPLYVAHYKQKMPSISDTALCKLIDNTQNPHCVIKEVSNSISAGIYISHGHASIYGSDVQDWARYEEMAKQLPDLRLPVESFEHFCLLLKKDATTINTALDSKTSESLTLLPFDDTSPLEIRAYNDINIIFGDKGSGKSCILKAVAKHYSENGIASEVYESSTYQLEEIYDVKGRDLTVNLNQYDVDYCTDQIKDLRNSGEVEVTNLKLFYNHFAAKSRNKNAQKILLKDIDSIEESRPRKKFIDFNEAEKVTREFLDFFSQTPSIKNELSEQDFSEATRILSKLTDKLHYKKNNTFSGWKEVCMLNSAISTFRLEVERKTGIPAKPTTTGFLAYAKNRIKIEVNANDIIQNTKTKIPVKAKKIGNLGQHKGELECLTNFKFNDGTSTVNYSSVSKVNKTTQKKFIAQVKKIAKHVYTEKLFHEISELNSIENVEEIKTVYELLLFQRYFALDGQRYVPSSGEASMVMLEQELAKNKEVYILDEPEKSLGNEYINDVIVPLIKERARAGKKIFISTHDANIAVRTLPYNSIYRRHDCNGYNTYVGNPFSNNLMNLNNDSQFDWKEISMKTLEGGEQAFGERGKIYGKN